MKEKEQVFWQGGTNAKSTYEYIPSSLFLSLRAFCVDGKTSLTNSIDIVLYTYSIHTVGMEGLSAAPKLPLSEKES